MSDDELSPEHHAAQIARSAATDRIVRHTGARKVIIAGPGTGKTHLFKEIFASRADPGGRMLTLTFINALVDDLCLELKGVADVRTLHSFARSMLQKETKIYPSLPKVIREDGQVLLGADIDFENKLHTLDASGGLLDFYSKRRKYYDHFGYSDVIVALVRILQNAPDRIPQYAQIVVDEFQDFNRLEVELIELLAQKSPIAIAGDDDQAIYEFKNSSPDFIRVLHGQDRPEFASFPLPFCSRSTRVIVEGINDIIRNATDAGHLVGRVDKPYQYFPCAAKDSESAAYPNIIHKRLEDRQIPWFIESAMEDIAEEVRRKFDVLVICPFGSQTERIGKSLRSKGLNSVTFREKEQPQHYLDGLRILMKDRKSNLGWRIVAKQLLSAGDFAAFLSNTTDCDKLAQDLLLQDIREAVTKDVRTLKAAMEGGALVSEDVKVLLSRLGYDEEHSRAAFLKTQFAQPERENSCDPAVKNIPVTVTTVQSSKGLAADYVFITHFDRRYLGEDGITNQSICNFLVALTRARKKVWLLSTSDQASPFLDWIGKAKIQSV